MMRALNGEVAEWSKAHAWKVCIRQRIEGSNPSLTATIPQRLIQHFSLQVNGLSLNILAYVFRQLILKGLLK